MPPELLAGETPSARDVSYAASERVSDFLEALASIVEEVSRHVKHYEYADEYEFDDAYEYEDEAETPQYRIDPEALAGRFPNWEFRPDVIQHSRAILLNDPETYDELDPYGDAQACIANCRIALKHRDPDELRHCIEMLLDITRRVRIVNAAMADEVLHWIDCLDSESTELIYLPRQTGIYVPRLIVQTNEALILAASRQPELLYSVSPRKFEEVIREILDAFGYEAHLTARTRDGGRDIVAISSQADISVKLIVECKRYQQSRKVGLAFVQRLLGVKIGERANKALLVTTSSFSKPAKEFASHHFWDLGLKDMNAVVRWAQRYMALHQS